MFWSCEKITLPGFFTLMPLIAQQALIAHRIKNFRGGKKINHEQWAWKDFLLHSCDFKITLTIFVLPLKRSNHIFKMNPEEHELYLKATTEELSTKRVVAEHWETNSNGRNHPLFVEFVVSEEMESESFNEKFLKKLNEHNETKGIEFATRHSCQRLFIKKNSIEILKTVSCSHSLRWKMRKKLGAAEWTEAKETLLIAKQDSHSKIRKLPKNTLCRE